MITSVGEMLSALLVAVPTSWITVHFSLNRFYKEKWWEAKRSNYVAILEALHHLKRAEERYDRQLRYPDDEPETATKRSRKEVKRYSDELDKLIDLASFHLGDESID